MATRTDYPIVLTDHPTCSNWWQPDYPAFLFSHLRWIKKVFFSSEAEPVSTQQEAQLINTPRSLRVETVSVFFFFFLFLLFLYFSSLCSECQVVIVHTKRQTNTRSRKVTMKTERPKTLKSRCTKSK